MAYDITKKIIIMYNMSQLEVSRSNRRKHVMQGLIMFSKDQDKRQTEIESSIIQIFGNTEED